MCLQLAWVGASGLQLARSTLTCRPSLARVGLQPQRWPSAAPLACRPAPDMPLTQDPSPTAAGKQHRPNPIQQVRYLFKRLATLRSTVPPPPGESGAHMG